MEPLHITKLVRVGTSHAVVVPVNILSGLGWKRGDNLIFTFATNEQLVVRKISDEQARALKRLDTPDAVPAGEALETIE